MPRIDIRTVAALIATLIAASSQPVVAQDPVIKPTTTRPIGTRLPGPSGVIGRQLADGRIEVRWTRVADAVRYDVTRSIGNVGTNVFKPGSTDTVFVDTDVKAGYTYWYVVQAVDDAGTAGLKTGSNAVVSTRSSSTATESLMASTPTGDPTSGDAGEPGWSVIKSVRVSTWPWSDPRAAVAGVDWEFTQGGVSFIVERAITYPTKSAWQTLLPTGVLRCCSYSEGRGISGLPEGSKIVFRITAVDSANPTRKSIPVTSNEYVVSYAQLAAPARFAGTQQADGTIRLTWAPVAGAARYWLKFGWDLSGRTISLAATDTTFVDPDVLGGQSYRYTIYAQSPAWVDGLKATATVTAKISAPSPMIVTAWPPVSTSVALNGSRALPAATGLVTVRWVSLDEAVATVDATGTVTGRSAGTARVFATGVFPDHAVLVQPFRVVVTP